MNVHLYVNGYRGFAEYFQFLFVLIAIDDDAALSNFGSIRSKQSEKFGGVALFPSCNSTWQISDPNRHTGSSVCHRTVTREVKRWLSDWLHRWQFSTRSHTFFILFIFFFFIIIYIFHTLTCVIIFSSSTCCILGSWSLMYSINSSKFSQASNFLEWLPRIFRATLKTASIPWAKSISGSDQRQIRLTHKEWHKIEQCNWM